MLSFICTYLFTKTEMQGNLLKVVIRKGILPV